MKYRVDFIPFSETIDLSSEEKVSYILSKVVRNTILVLEDGLSHMEEMNLIEKTMTKIDYNKFVGIKLFSIEGGDDFKWSRLFNSLSLMS